MAGDRKGRFTPWPTRGQLAGEVRDELEGHLAMQIDDLVAEGWSREAAADEARRRFGDRARVEKELLTMARRRQARTRRLELAADLVMDVRLALRQLVRQRVFAVAVIVVIALGVGASTAVFAVVDGGVFRPLPFRDGERLVYLHDVQVGEVVNSASLPEVRDWAREADFLDGMVALHSRSERWRGERGWDVFLSGRVEGDLRRVVGRDPLLGRWFTPEEIRARAPVAVLDEATWRERFGARPDIVGQPLHLADGDRTIVGVAPRPLNLLRAAGSGSAVAVWLPLVESPYMIRGTHFLRVVGRLKDGVTLDAARARASAIATGIQEAESTPHGLALVPARDVLVGDARPILVALAGAALFVLLTVCANLANLFYWRSLVRGREFAVRAALGASRGRMIRQVLTESIVVGVLGGAAGLAMSHLVIGVTRAVAHRAGALAPTSSADPRLIVFAVVVSIVVGLLFGLWPALRASRADLAPALSQGAPSLTAAAGATWRRKVLVAAEVALGVVLLSGTGVLVRSLVHMLNEDPGFRPANVIAFRLLLGDRYRDDDARIVAYTDELRQRILALPGVLAAGTGSELPLEGSDTNGDFEVAGRTYTDENRPMAKKRVVGPGYFEAMGIPVLRGRAFAERDRLGAPDVVIISDAIARRHFPGEDPIGKRLEFMWGPGDDMEIVGVVGDVRHDGLNVQPQGMLYRPAGQFPGIGAAFVVRAAGPVEPLVAAIRHEVQAVDPSVPLFDVRTLEDVVDRWVAPRRDMVLVLAGFAAIAALLAAVGAYAVTAQTVSLRTREIGLRVACGASPRDILGLVAREGALMIGGGMLVGILGALAATRALRSLLYGVSPADPIALCASVGLLALVAALAVLVPARRAARLDPMVALRLS